MPKITVTRADGGSFDVELEQDAVDLLVTQLRNPVGNDRLRHVFPVEGGRRYTRDSAVADVLVHDEPAPEPADAPDVPALEPHPQGEPLTPHPDSAVPAPTPGDPAAQ